MRHFRATFSQADAGAEKFSLGGSSVVAAFTLDQDGRFLSANAKLATSLGISSPRELSGRSLGEFLVGQKDWPAWRRDCDAGNAHGVTLSLRGADGRSVALRGDLERADKGGKSAAEQITGVFTDVSEEEKLRTAVQRSARMEALGSLTSGIAHDFNNLLTVLVGNLYLVGEELRDQPEPFAKLKVARDAAKRGADLIRQLLAFARRESLDADTIDPCKVVNGLLPLLQRALGSRITLEAKLQPDAGTTRCNAAQLESVVVNLAVNAKDAIEANGNIVVSVESAHLQADSARLGLPFGEYVKVAVADNGCGIPPETLSRVFEPFFSTKGERGGTGLGLSMVRWFAQQAGGAVYIDSAPRKGTKVSLLLPRCTDTAAETAAKTMPLSTLPSGTESVVVFAREEGLCATIQQILEVLGYTVHLCAEPAELLATVKSKPVDLLLVDAAAQPSAVRQHLISEAVAARPALRLVLAVDAGEASRLKPPKGVVLLAKPFTLGDLATTLRTALSERRTGR